MSSTRLACTVVRTCFCGTIPVGARLTIQEIVEINTRAPKECFACCSSIAESALQADGQNWKMYKSIDEFSTAHPAV